MIYISLNFVSSKRYLLDSLVGIPFGIFAEAIFNNLSEVARRFELRAYLGY